MIKRQFVGLFVAGLVLGGSSPVLAGKDQSQCQNTVWSKPTGKDQSQCQNKAWCKPVGKGYDKSVGNYSKYPGKDQVQSQDQSQNSIRPYRNKRRIIVGTPQGGVQPGGQPQRPQAPQRPQGPQGLQGSQGLQTQPVLQ
jgi:hypothetical protein